MLRPPPHPPSPTSRVAPMRVSIALMILIGGLVLTATPRALPADEPAATAPTPELAAQGKTLYTQLCSHCHGVNMVNPGTSSFDLRKFPHDQQPRFVNSVTHGKNTMPAWGDMLQPGEIDALWAYVMTGGKM